MIRKTLFWVHLAAGVAAGVCILIMAATGVVLSFERQWVEYADRDVGYVAIPNDAPARPVNDLLEAVRLAGMGDPTAIAVRNEPRAAMQVSIGRGKAVYVDPFSGAVLGASSARAHAFFFAVERLHRTLGAPMGSKSAGHWLMAVSNLMFGGLILMGLVLWLRRKWNWKAVRASIAFRTGLRGRAREWNWHNAMGIWCAIPLLVIALSGVVMSFGWANALLFRLSGSAPPAFGRDGAGRRAQARDSAAGPEPNYDYLLTAAKTLNPAWRTITLNVTRDGGGPVTAAIDTGNGGQPQDRTQYLLARETGAVVKTIRFADGSLGQRLRAFVRFGHTGEYYGWPGQAIAAIASFGACVLVYSGLALSIRRLAGWVRGRRRQVLAGRGACAEEPAV